MSPVDTAGGGRDVKAGCCTLQGSQKQVGTDSERRTSGRSLQLTDPNVESGMVLPFEPMIMTFRGVHYYVDLPPVSSSKPVWQLAGILSAEQCN